MLILLMPSFAPASARGVGLCARQRRLLVLAVAGSRPGGRGTFLCFAKEKYPKERRAGFVGPLRGHAALLSFGGVRANSAAPQTCAPLDPPKLALLASSLRQLETENQTPQGRAMARPCSAVGCSDFPAVMRRRVAQGQAEKEAQMFEPAGRVSVPPAWPEQRSVPAQRADESGSPSLCLLSLGEARESESPAGARPGYSENQQPASSDAQPDTQPRQEAQPFNRSPQQPC